MADYKLNLSTMDLDLSSYAIRYTTLEETIQQRVTLALSHIKGQWFRDRNVGLPFRRLLRERGNKAFVDTFLQGYIEAIEDIEKVTEYSSTIGVISRKLEVTFTAKTVEGYFTMTTGV